jgi:hypothetical protein
VAVPWSATTSLIRGDLHGTWEQVLKDKNAGKNVAIKVGNINGPVFLISATKDEMWTSKEMSDQIIKRLESNNFLHYFKHLAIGGDHVAPLNHFDEINDFPQDHFIQDNSNNCQRSLLM